ncbi:hypothetical protein GCM10011385_00680 [Nitratireductor aestuarii]|uniref:DUF4345 domain-containing protein n=2 Tax=Nitratireductor aestuarii TaxID=1735103 RepID=A0A916RF61_9HYPH|nr:hypothetical protein GCM10011385_00680 [Nitratireductor aestuarii]
MERNAMNLLKAAIMALAAVPMLTGAMDVILGASIFSISGSALGEAASKDPVVDSQVRFWGAIWFSFGIMLFIAARDLRAHALWFRILCAGLFLGGVGRLISAFAAGLPPAPLMIATLVELVVMPLIALWHSKTLVRRQTELR